MKSFFLFGAMLTGVFFLSLGFFLFIAYVSSQIIDRRALKKKVKDELEKGARYGYVCETVYPDTEGKVVIGGQVFSARSNGTFRRGDVVLCKEGENGLVIPLLALKKK